MIGLSTKFKNNKRLRYVEYLLCVRCLSNIVISISSFNLHKNPGRSILVSPFVLWHREVPQLPEVTQLLSNRARIWFQIIRIIFNYGLYYTFEYNWPWTKSGLQAPILGAVKNLCITYISPPYKWFLHSSGFSSTYSSAPMDSTNHGLCSIVKFTIEKYLHKGGSTQFKSMLLKGQLYILKDLLINNNNDIGFPRWH